MLHKMVYLEGEAAGFIRSRGSEAPTIAARRLSPYRELALRTNDSLWIEFDSDWQSGFVKGSTGGIRR